MGIFHSSLEIERVECPACSGEIDTDNFVCPECGQRQICFEESKNQFYRIVDLDQHESLTVSGSEFKGLYELFETAMYSCSALDTIIKQLESQLIEVRDYAGKHGSHSDMWFVVYDWANELLGEETSNIRYSWSDRQDFSSPFVDHPSHPLSKLV